MNIELELHLEGPEANKETLLDLSDWLGRENIPDIHLQNKEMPLVEGQMGGSIDPYTLVVIILTIPPALHAAEQLARSIIQWEKMRELKVSINTEIRNADNETQQKINAKLEEIHQKRETKRHSN
jgi:uncharacterized membrane protein (DUF106 family)